MSARELFVAAIRVLGLYVLSTNALYYWTDFIGQRVMGADRSDRDSFTVGLVYALTHSVVGLYLLICAEQVATFAEMSRRSPATDESDQARLPDDESMT